MTNQNANLAADRFHDPAELQAEIDSAAGAERRDLNPEVKGLDGPVRTKHLVDLTLNLRSWIVGYARYGARRTLQLHDELAKRVAALEERRSMAFQGAHDPANAYAAGAVVQRGGSLYVALIGTSETPGTSSDWRQIGSTR